MKLQAKLLLAQAPLWLALVLVASVALLAVNRLGRESQQILQDNYRSVLAAERMKEALERVDSGAVWQFSGHREDGMATIVANERKFEDELAVQQGNITEEGEAEKTDALAARWKAYRSAVDDFGRLEEPAQRDRYFSLLQPDFVAAKGAADDVLALNQDAMSRKSDLAERDARKVTGLLVGVCIGALFAGTYGSTVLTARMLRPVSVLTQTVQRIGAGDLAVRAVVDGSDEIAGLAREFNALAESVASYRKSSLGDLIQAQQSAQAAIDSLGDPVIVFGSAGPVLALNRAAEALLGVSADLADPLLKVPPVARDAIEKARAWVVSGKGAFVPHGYEEAVRVPVPDGEAWFLPRASAIYTDVGISGVTVLMQDVTRLRRFDELTRDLVATVAHEFRTPLTSLQMAVHLCLEQSAGPINDKQADLLQAAREDCERLMDLVEDLLDVSRLQAGRAELQRSRVDAETMAREVADAHAGAAEARKVTVRIGIPPDVRVDADPERLRLVLANLVSNAVRHAREGGAVSIRAIEEGAGVRFEVLDDGPGIPPEWRARVFEKFVRVPGSEGGAGLGLHIAKEIVAAHQGEIGVDAPESGGTLVWFTIPKAPGSQPGASS